MIIKPDVLVTQPRAIDFPIWRWNMSRFRDMFGKVIVCFTGIDQIENYQEFIQKAMLQDDITFLDCPEFGGNQDWRDVAINHMLGVSKSEWVLFLEQDFFWKDRQFLGTIFNLEDPWEIHGFLEKRLHPACIVISRSAIERTSNIYSARQDEGYGDHFGFWTTQIEKFANIRTLQELGLVERQDYYHMAGLTHNYTLAQDLKFNQIYKRDEFFTYNYFARKVPVEQDPRFLTRSLLAEEGLMNMNPTHHLFGQ